MVEVLQIAVLVDKRTTVMFQKIDKFNWNPSIERFSFLIILSHSKKKGFDKNVLPFRIFSKKDFSHDESWLC